MKSRIQICFQNPKNQPLKNNQKVLDLHRNWDLKREIRWLIGIQARDLTVVKIFLASKALDSEEFY